MPYASSNAPSDATKGSTHSSAIMIIPERFEYNHTPLSTMGTPVNRPGTSASTNTYRPSSRNQMIRYQNAPGALTVPERANQPVSRDQMIPYQPPPSESSNASFRQTRRPEYEGGTENAHRWVAQQRTMQRDDQSQDSNASNSTVRAPDTQIHQPSGRRSSSAWVGPTALLGAALLASSLGRNSSNRSHHTRRDRDGDNDDEERYSCRYRAPACDSDDEDDRAAHSSRRRDDARDGNSRSHRSRRSHNHDRDDDRRRSGR